MLRLQNRHLSMAFEKWQFEAAEMARSKFLMGGAVQRLLKRQLSMAWEAWQFNAAALARDKFLLAGAAQRMVHRYTPWSDYHILT